METIISEIRKALHENASAQERAKRTRWEKPYQDDPRIYGVPTPVVRQLSARLFRHVKQKPKRAILDLCEALLASGHAEEQTIAFDWAFRLKKNFEASDYRRFESWVMKHVHSWGACDDLCTHALGAFIYRFPHYVDQLTTWTQSPNRWVRRASAVALIYSARRSRSLDRVFQIADLLLTDPDVMVQKGYGWMLKETSKNLPDRVFSYVQRHKRVMPRTALRYAIEKLPPDKRTEAMKKPH